MSILQLSWLLIAFFVIVIACYLFLLFHKDKDKRKLMYSLGLFFSTISFFILSFGGLIDIERYDLLYNLFRYGAASYLILIFHTIFSLTFWRSKDFDPIFISFIFFNIFSFLLLLFDVVSTASYLLFMILGLVLILFICFTLVLIDRDVSSVFFLLSIIFCALASMSINISQISEVSYQNFFVINGYFISYMFLAIIFLVNPKQVSDTTKGISAYFSMKTSFKKVKQELQKSQERYKLIAEHSSDVIAMTTFSTKPIYTYISPSVEKILGYSPKDLIGTNALDLIYPEDKKFLFDKMSNYKVFVASKIGLKDKIQLHEDIEYRIIDKSGRWHHFESSADLAGNQIVFVSRDMTERRKNEEELQKLASVVRNSNELVNLATLDGKMIFLNEAGSRILGIEQNDLSNVTIFDVIPPEYQSLVHDEVLPSLHERNMWKGEFQYINRKTGKRTDVLATTFMIKDVNTQDPLYLANVSLDITKLKETQKKLEALNKTLEEKVNLRTKEIQELLKQKDDLINQLGHDLKNPLGPLIHLLPVLQKHCSDRKDQEIISVLNRNVGYMKNLVHKTLEIARLNSPKTTLHYELVDLYDYVDTIIKTNTFMINEKHINIQNNISKTIRLSADAFLIEELFTNLINNSVKYSPFGGNVEILAIETDEEIHIIIKDEGIGLTNEQTNHLFKEFYKADQSRHDFESTGLGLAICKRIVEKHQGKIWVESEGLGKGTIFHLVFPKHNIEQEIDENNRYVSNQTLDVTQ